MAKTYVIGVTGGSGSGKTSLIKSLRQNFSRKDICIVSQDDYYLTKEFQKKDKNGIENFDRPGSIDKKAFIRDVNSLINGEKVTRPEYTFNNKNATPSLLIFEPAPILIVEGLFIFHYKKIRKLLDLKVFVQAKDNLKVIRRITRDKIERNYPLEDVLYRYQHHVYPAFEKYILPYKYKADIVINNNDDFDTGLNVFEGFLKQKIKDIK